MPALIDTGPVPPLGRYPRAGDIWVLTKAIATKGGDTYAAGTEFHLLERTEEAPFGYKCPEGNWKVVANGRATIWSSVPYMIHGKLLALKVSGPELPLAPVLSRFEREEPL